MFLAGLLLLWIYTSGISENPLKWEEPRRCLVAMEMIQRGDYVVPRVLGEPYLNKPPLQNWLLVFLSGNDARRVGPLSIRLITLLALAGIALFLWRLGVSGQDGRPSVLPPLIFLTMGIVLQFGRAGEIDMLFTFLITAALGCFELGRRRGSHLLQWTVPQVLLGAGVLTKGIAPLFFYPPAFYCALRRRDLFRFSPVAFGLGLLSLAALVAAWLLPYSTLASTAALEERWIAQITDRTTETSLTQALKHLLRYPLMIVGVALPWSLYPLFLRRASWRELAHRVRADGYLLQCWVVVLWGCLMFLFVPGIRERYLIPVLPAAAVLLASLIEHEAPRRGAPGESWWKSGWFAASLMAAGWVAFIAVSALARGSPILLPLVLGLLAIAAFAAAARRAPANGSLLLLAGLLYGVAHAGVQEPRVAQRNRAHVDAARELASAVQDDSPVVCQDVSHKLSFALSQYLQRPLQSRPPSAGPYYLVVTGEADAPAPPARLVASAASYRMWYVGKPEAWSLLGQPLPRPLLSQSVRREREQQLAQARAEHQRRGHDVETLIWLGRRNAYLGRYNDAVAIYSEGIGLFPQEPRLYRHRGHRYLTLRQLDRAVADLEQAARLVQGTPDAVEPDGLPNARNLPTSTLHSNVWYHLGLGYYLRGEFEQAASAYGRCLAVSRNPDMLCATSHWLYMTLRRLGREHDAQQLLEPVQQDMDIIENRAYHRLLMFYKGRVAPEELLAEAATAENTVDFATIGYGVGNWQLLHGRIEQAEQVWRKVVSGSEWAAFGHLAAEAELARMQARHSQLRAVLR